MCDRDRGRLIISYWLKDQWDQWSKSKADHSVQRSQDGLPGNVIGEVWLKISCHGNAIEAQSLLRCFGSAMGKEGMRKRERESSVMAEIKKQKRWEFKWGMRGNGQWVFYSFLRAAISCRHINWWAYREQLNHGGGTGRDVLSKKDNNSPEWNMSHIFVCAHWRIESIRSVCFTCNLLHEE